MSATDLAVATGGGNGHGSTWILVLWGVIAMVIGGVHLLDPQLAWRMRRWQYRNPDAMAPSDAALGLSRVVGGIFVIVGAVFFVYGLTRI
ncbi:MAG: hypothetical protein QOE76_2416 [Frankiales bacterium]|jgi:UPF0716 family protein affecting phage T7 exclusion|nr:hypothetical protein [Frankiales bacterium]